jgi:hypothetical protein
MAVDGAPKLGALLDHFGIVILRIRAGNP